MNSNLHEYFGTLTDEMQRLVHCEHYLINETHNDNEGNTWYIITVVTKSLDRWLQSQCDTNEEMCGESSISKYLFPRYNVHESLMSYITLIWS